MMDFLPLYFCFKIGSEFCKKMKIGKTISRKLMRASPSPEKTSQRFPGIAFTAFVTPCSIESREGHQIGLLEVLKGV